MNDFRSDGKIEFRALFPYRDAVPCADHAKGFLCFVNCRERVILPVKALRNKQCFPTDAVLFNAHGRTEISIRIA